MVNSNESFTEPAAEKSVNTSGIRADAIHNFLKFDLNKALGIARFEIQIKFYGDDVTMSVIFLIQTNRFSVYLEN